MFFLKNLFMTLTHQEYSKTLKKSIFLENVRKHFDSIV
jgi:hypothetical protein